MENLLIINPWSGKIGPNTFIEGFIQENLDNHNKITMLYPYPDSLSSSLMLKGCNISFLSILKLNHIANPILKICYRLFIEVLLFFILPFFFLRRKYTICFVNTEMYSFCLFPLSIFVKITVVVHSLSFSTNGLLSDLLFKIQELSVANYVAVSKAVMVALKGKKIEKPIVMAYNGINLDLYPKANVKINKSKIEILSVIHPVPHKGAHFLVEVVRQILVSTENVHFSIVGWDNVSKDEQYKTMIEDKVEEYNLKNHISFVNCTDDIHKEYAKSNILVHPSENESFGYVIAECMAFNLPVVAFEVGGIPEIVENNYSGFLITPYDVNLMAEKLLMLIENEDLRGRFGKRGREIIEEKFQLKPNLNKIIKFLNI